MMRLRTLWPSSLYGQLLLVVALALLVAQAANTALLVASAQAGAQVEATSMLIARVSNQFERQRLNKDMPRRGGRGRRHSPIFLVTSGAPLNAENFEVHDELGQRATEYLLAVDPDVQAVTLSLGPISGLPPEMRKSVIERSKNARFDDMPRGKVRDAVLLTLKNGDDQWISAAAYVRPLSGWPFVILLGQTVVLYLAVLIPLALIARRIARPLRILTRRVQTSGLVGEAAPLDPQGPSDVRELIQAFNGAQQRLSALLTEKDVMLGAIGHDLKTPLASLRVRIESVEDDIERDKMAATVTEMTAILDDILMFARLGKGSEAPIQTDMQSLLETVIDEFPGDAAITFLPNETREIATVRPVLLKRAIRNLIDNALHYGGTANIGLVGGLRSVEIIVEDNGPGIPADQITKMFEPFARAESSRSRQSGGTGLGLTIARAIAQAHGGALTLENRPEGGLRGRLTLPA
jgi:signal transduction histidine kinase